ncbi:MAG: hypothetical protein ACOVQT_05840 [Rubrivivax sp.]
MQANPPPLRLLESRPRRPVARRPPATRSTAPGWLARLRAWTQAFGRH